ncbi:MAG: type II toxin-antitoxin system RelE/ParE family toxin [Ignavibacteriae bacterium]|nr:type II toxin-antitoxin system RelE/ParE family toxin [Ignavibacteriota bacterium]
MEIKPILWVASSKHDLVLMEEGAKDEIGHALFLAQIGGKSDKAKPLKGFGSAAILEIVEYNIRGTYRAVYTVKFKEAIAVLHVFQKKSTQGIKTSKQDIELIKSRLKLAESEYKTWLIAKKGDS